MKTLRSCACVVALALSPVGCGSGEGDAGADGDEQAGGEEGSGADDGSGEGGDDDSGEDGDDGPDAGGDDGDDGGTEEPPVNDCVTPASDGFARPFAVDAVEYPFASCAVELPQGTLHYIDEGPLDAEETILMVHGNPTWSFLYRNVVKAMVADGHRVIVVDHLGLGMSDVPSTADFDYRPRSHADNLEALVVGLDLQGLTLVVQDWGGPIGLRMATREPDRVARVLIMNTWAWAVDEDEPGDFHALVGWSQRAKTSAQDDPLFFCNFALQGSTNAIAAQVDPTMGALFEAVRHAYLAPAVDPSTGEALYAEPCAPMQIFAESILDDNAFQAEVEADLGVLVGKPYALHFGLRDRNFGVLRCNPMADVPCPGASACVCDPDYLPTGDCDSPMTAPHHLCLLDGEPLEPSGDRFVELLGEDALVRRSAVADAEHMIQEWDPEGVIDALRELIAAP